MSFEQPIFGYTGQVWSAAYQAMQYLQMQLASTTNPASTESAAQATLQTLRNALAALTAQNYATAWQQEALLLGQVRALPITIGAAPLAALTARSQTYLLASLSLQSRVPQPPFGNAASVLPTGKPTIADPDLLGFYRSFALEVPPTLVDPTTLISVAQGVADDFGQVASDVQTDQGLFLTQAYDTALRVQATQQSIVNLLKKITSSGFSAAAFISSGYGGASPTQVLWNQLAVLPQLVMDAAFLSSTPYNLATQQNMVVRNAMLTIAQQLALFLLVLRQPTVSQVNLAAVQQGDNLMDVAARSLGDFEQWSEIAAINSLDPPYTAAQASSGVAAYGSQILLPTAGSSVSPVGAPPNYFTNFLGVDLLLGPLGQAMLPWQGDFQTISGYNNLSLSLGRRVQTALGSLIYHTNYGSLLPPEVGNVEVSYEADKIAAFGTSALLSDPRVAQVISSTATILDNGQISFVAVVQPAGFGSQPIPVNVVVGG